MVGVLAIVTGWALLTPAVLLIYVRVTGNPYLPEILLGILHIAASIPMLVACTLGGVFLIGWGTANLSRDQRDPFS